MQNIQIFTDGGYRSTSGIGGWGALIIIDNCIKELKGSEFDTTNNRMELTAVIESLKTLGQPYNIALTTDSNYVKKGITQWINKWRNNNWRTFKNKPVKNKDLWLELDKLVKHHNISWNWVKSHSGHTENEYADQLANKAMDELFNKNKELL